MKTLRNSPSSPATKSVKDIVKFGDVDAWELVCKASSDAEGWMKSTKAMYVGHGVLVQVTTQQRSPDGTYAVAEAVTFVPGACIARKKNDDGVTERTIVVEK